MGPLAALLGILGLALLVGAVIARADGLAFLAPKKTRGITLSAEGFCVGRCRMPDGRCPLTRTTERAADCPLWRYIAADVPTAAYGSPFEHLRAA